MTTNTGLTRIQIDCGAPHITPTRGMFTSLPLNPHHSTCDVRKTPSTFPVNMSAKEVANDAEREGLLQRGAALDADEKRVVLLDRTTRVSLGCCACSCTLLVICFLVLIGLALGRVQSLDASMGISDVARSSLVNMNSILSSTARAASTLDRLGDVTLHTAMVTVPHIEQMLNDTQATIAGIHGLVERPVISIGRSG